MLRFLRVNHFRNLDAVEQECQSVNIWIGDNATGKTSLLEAIYYSTYLTSFRTAQQDQMIAWGSPYLFVSADGVFADAVRICRFRRSDIEIKIGAALTRQKALQKLYSGVAAAISSPHINSLVMAEPQRRRQWLDSIMFHMEHNAKQLVSQYEHALLSRNAGLKRKYYDDDEFWLHRLVATGEALDAQRRACFTCLHGCVRKWLTVLGLDSVQLTWHSGWAAEEPLLSQYYRQIPEDRVNGFTRLGAHKADVHVYWQDRLLARQFASRGQNKLLNLALLFGQLDCLAPYVRTRMLLLDDITAEFDRQRLELLCKTVFPQIAAQLFITSIEYNSTAFTQLRAQLGTANVALARVEAGRVLPLN